MEPSEIAPSSLSQADTENKLKQLVRLLARQAARDTVANQASSAPPDTASAPSPDSDNA